MLAPLSVFYCSPIHSWTWTSRNGSHDINDGKPPLGFLFIPYSSNFMVFIESNRYFAHIIQTSIVYFGNTHIALGVIIVVCSCSAMMLNISIISFSFFLIAFYFLLDVILRCFHLIIKCTRTSSIKAAIVPISTDRMIPNLSTFPFRSGSTPVM